MTQAELRNIRGHAKGVRVNINLAHCLNQVLGALSCQQSACSTEYSSECMCLIPSSTTFRTFTLNTQRQRPSSRFLTVNC